MCIRLSQGSVATHLKCDGIFSECYCKFSPDCGRETTSQIGYYLLKFKAYKKIL